MATLFDQIFFIQPTRTIPDVTPQLAGPLQAGSSNTGSIQAAPVASTQPTGAVPVVIGDRSTPGVDAPGVVNNYYTTNNVAGSSTPGAGTPDAAYNTVQQIELNAGQTVNFPANTLHSISYKVMQGTCAVTIGTDTQTYIQGEVDSETASTTLSVPYSFAVGAGSKIRIKIITL